MPYIERDDRDILKAHGLRKLVTYIKGLKSEKKKGLVAYAVMKLALEVFDPNYFGISTATDAVRSALVEMKKKLADYEETKKHMNGDV